MDRILVSNYKNMKPCELGLNPDPNPDGVHTRYKQYKYEVIACIYCSRRMIRNSLRTHLMRSCRKFTQAKK